MPDLRFPGTVSVIGKDLLRDQQALRFSDVIRDIGGAVQTIRFPGDDDPLVQRYRRRLVTALY